MNIIIIIIITIIIVIIIIIIVGNIMRLYRNRLKMKTL